MDLCLKDIGLAVKAPSQHKNRKQSLSPVFQILLASQMIRELMSKGGLGKVLCLVSIFMSQYIFKLISKNKNPVTFLVGIFFLI